ncbi:MAG: hypothetical protein HDQ88_07390, partial [Clostridia bacterium]|nr:hypothetical protein [Clostridia bacterium]
MTAFLSLETLVANALIELSSRMNVLTVTFEQVVHYAWNVERLIKRRTGKDVISLLSRQYQYDMEGNEYIDVTFDDIGNPVFGLKPDADVKAMEDFYKWPHSIDMINALTDGSS